jgi:hypothetical protein
VAVRMSDEGGALFNDSIGDEPRTDDAVILREQDACKKIKVRSFEFANAGKLARFVEFREAAALNLITDAIPVGCINIGI